MYKVSITPQTQTQSVKTGPLPTLIICIFNAICIFILIFCFSAVIVFRPFFKSDVQIQTPESIHEISYCSVLVLPWVKNKPNAETFLNVSCPAWNPLFVFCFATISMQFCSRRFCKNRVIQEKVYIKLQRFLNLRYWSTGGGT